MPEVTVTEAGRRASDVVQQAIVDGYPGFWLALRLSDGGSDGIAYASKADAIRYQLHEQQCAYLRVPRDHASPREMSRYLELHRLLYAKGCRLADPDGDPGREVIGPDKLEDLDAAVRDLMRRAGL